MCLVVVVAGGWFPCIPKVMVLSFNNHRRPRGTVTKEDLGASPCGLALAPTTPEGHGLPLTLGRPCSPSSHHWAPQQSAASANPRVYGNGVMLEGVARARLGFYHITCQIQYRPFMSLSPPPAHLPTCASVPAHPHPQAKVYFLKTGENQVLAASDQC